MLPRWIRTPHTQEVSREVDWEDDSHREHTDDHKQHQDVSLEGEVGGSINSTFALNFLIPYGCVERWRHVIILPYYCPSSPFFCWENTLSNHEDQIPSSPCIQEQNPASQWSYCILSSVTSFQISSARRTTPAQCLDMCVTPTNRWRGGTSGAHPFLGLPPDVSHQCSQNLVRGFSSPFLISPAPSLLPLKAAWQATHTPFPSPCPLWWILLLTRSREPINL